MKFTRTSLELNNGLTRLSLNFKKTANFLKAYGRSAEFKREYVNNSLQRQTSFVHESSVKLLNTCVLWIVSGKKTGGAGFAVQRDNVAGPHSTSTWAHDCGRDIHVDKVCWQTNEEAPKPPC